MAWRTMICDTCIVGWFQVDIDDQQAFSALQIGAATPPAAKRYLPEPHPSWTTALEQAWLERYVR